MKNEQDNKTIARREAEDHLLSGLAADAFVGIFEVLESANDALEDSDYAALMYAIRFESDLRAQALQEFDPYTDDIYSDWASEQDPTEWMAEDDSPYPQSDYASASHGE